MGRSAPMGSKLFFFSFKNSSLYHPQSNFCPLKVATFGKVDKYFPVTVISLAVISMLESCQLLF